MKSNPKLAEALVNLRGNRDFEVVLEGLKEHILEETHRCVEHEGSIQLRSSGAVKALQWWVSYYQSAPADLNKFKNQTGK